MKAMYGYCVRTDFGFPMLIRYHNMEAEIYCGNGTWERSPGDDEILVGKGDSVWWDDITEEDAKKYSKEIDESVNNQR